MIHHYDSGTYTVSVKTPKWSDSVSPVQSGKEFDTANELIKEAYKKLKR